MSDSQKIIEDDHVPPTIADATNQPVTAVMSQRPIEIISYVLVTLMIVTVLHWRLLSAAIPGMMVYAITRHIELRLLAHRHWPQRAKMLSISFVIGMVCLLLFGIGLGLTVIFSRHSDFSWLAIKLAELLDMLRSALPGFFSNLLPDNINELHNNATGWLKQHGQQLSTIGINGARAGTLGLAGLIIGAMIAWSRSAFMRSEKPLTETLSRRLQRLENAFETVVFAQIRISAFNTTLTALYLLLILPLCGQHLPYAKTLVLLTFIVGLLPVIGNLISNTAIMAVSATISLELALASLVFLILIHKLEYFINARIIGSKIHARAWELLIAMIVMEAIFGIGGLVAAPVLYAYLKNELSAAGLIEQIPERQK